MRSRLIAFAVFLSFLLLLPSYSHAQQSAAATSFDSNGVRIHYVDRGHGTPVVLIHGFTHSFAQDWEMPGAVAALENAGYRVVGLDCRGHGESDKPRDAAKYGMEMVQDVIRLMDHLHIERAHVVGYSMGGFIANQILVNYPQRLLSVTLLGAGWEGEGETLRSYNIGMLALAEGLAKRDATVLYRLVLATPPSDEQIARLNAALFQRHDPDVLAAIVKGEVPLGEIPASRLRSTTVPVMAVVGDQDPHNRESAHRMATIVERLQLVELPGVTHAAEVKPATPYIVAFLDKHRGN